MLTLQAHRTKVMSDLRNHRAAIEEAVAHHEQLSDIEAAIDAGTEPYEDERSAL